MSGAAPLVSAVVATRNRAGLLPRSVQSVLDQRFEDLEVVVVDDASDDDTPEVVARLRARDPRVVALRLEARAGLAGARNRGLEAARGEFVAFNDDDDCWLPKKLEAQLRRFGERPGAQVVYSPAFHVRRDGSTALLGAERHEGRDAFARLLRSNFLASPCPLVRRAAIARVCGFDERLPALEDWDLWLRLAAVADFAFELEPVARVLVTAGSMSTQHERMAGAAALMIGRESALPLQQPRARSDFYEAIAHELIMHGAAGEGKRLLRRAIRLDPLPRRLVKGLAAELGRAPYVAGVRAWEALARARGVTAPPASRTAPDTVRRSKTW